MRLNIACAGSSMSAEAAKELFENLQSHLHSLEGGVSGEPESQVAKSGEELLRQIGAK